ncbi:hypothetical protein [Tautonia rosea]|nr:hypothetical protein [Tautonia rosea]
MPRRFLVGAVIEAEMGSAVSTGNADGMYRDVRICPVLVSELR